MTKEEVALQLTLARIKYLLPTKHSSSTDFNINVEYNKMLAEETVKMYNTIYNNLDIETTD